MHDSNNSNNNSLYNYIYIHGVPRRGRRASNVSRRWSRNPERNTVSEQFMLPSDFCFNLLSPSIFSSGSLFTCYRPYAVQ